MEREAGTRVTAAHSTPVEVACATIEPLLNGNADPYTVAWAVLRALESNGVTMLKDGVPLDLHGVL